jgi:5,10-methylenetetrahydromethanopterin reductase
VTEIGLGVAGNLPPAHYRELGWLAERAGFDVLAVFGDLMLGPPFAALQLAALDTRRIRLGPACVNPYTAHPVEIAGQVAALDHLSGGRAFLGLARGAWLERLGLATSRPVAALRDAVEVVRRLLAGDDAGYSGPLFHLEPGLRLRQPVLRPAVPLLVGTWSPRLCALAGELADEVKLGGSANPAMLAIVRGWIERGERAAGRPSGSVTMVAGAVTVIDADRRRARARAKREVAMYLDVVAAYDRTVEVDPELRSRLRDLVARGEREAAGRLTPDSLLDLFALAGTPADVAARVRALADAGARRVDLGPPLSVDGVGPGVELVRGRVMPELR